MLRGDVLALVILLLAACGGGGGGGGGPPPVQPTTPMRIAAEAIEIGPGQSQGELLVRLVGTPAQGPALLEVAVELPSGLVLPAANRLAAATALPTLDGDFVANRYVVLCGDAENSDAAILQPGDLFRLRVQPASPRTAGSYTVRFVSLRGASRNGIDDVLVDSAPLTTTVVVR